VPDVTKVYTVTELTRLIKGTLERAVGEVWVEGELSNVRRPASGHLYFTIKDAGSQLSAVMFRGARGGLKFEPADGLAVRASGEITVYEPYGNYQIVVRRMEQSGLGALQARFEALKEKLRAEGLFAAERKKPMPLLPQHVGVVTSETGAALRDILNVVTRRFPNLHLVLAPVRVQGEGAAAEIAAAIDLLNRRGGLDVMIVGRGGGSLEDLWCFNEESVARAIARSAIPVISAVGHEIDFTISDFVADLRAPTPSAAAELVVGTKEAFEGRLSELARLIRRAAVETGLRARNRLLAAERSYVFREPGNLVRRFEDRLERLGLSMAHSATGRLRTAQQRVDDGGLRLGHACALARQARAQNVNRLASQLKALDPLAVLARGYSVTCDASGKAVTDAAAVSSGDRLLTRLARGRIESEVTATRR